MPADTPPSPAFYASASRMVRLHRMIADGTDEGPEGEALRDEMDAPWYAMSDAERELVGGLSEDLYTVSATPWTPQEPGADARAGLDAAADAQARGEWGAALELLRRWKPFTDPADLSAARAAAWAGLGAADVAAVFREHAAVLRAPVRAGSG